MTEPNSDNPFASPQEPASQSVDPSAADAGRHDPYAVMRIPTYRKFFWGNLLAAGGMQMQSTAVAWEVYDRTQSEMALGYVGLAMFLPVVLLLPIAGHLADRWSRRWIVALAMLATSASSFALAAISIWQLDYRWIYPVLVVVGAGRAFSQPAKPRCCRCSFRLNISPAPSRGVQAAFNWRPSSGRGSPAC